MILGCTHQHVKLIIKETRLFPAKIPAKTSCDEDDEEWGEGKRACRRAIFFLFLISPLKKYQDTIQ